MMNTKEASHFLNKQQYSHIVDDFYDRAETKFFDAGIDVLTPCERIAISIGSFVGQMRDGGLKEYLHSPWAIFYGELPLAFSSVGLPEYSRLISEMQAQASLESPSQALWDEHEKPFWDYFYRSGNSDLDDIDRHLAFYIAKICHTED